MKINWKEILMHLLFWVVYMIVWGVRDMAYAPTFLDTIDSNLLGSALFAGPIYFNLYFLVPRFLLKRKRLAYVAALLPLVFLSSYATAQIFSLYFKSVHLGTSEFFGSMEGVAAVGGDFLVVYGLATCLYLINQWHIKERRIRELETASLKSELDLLKNQVNPHFMFNALNTIHVLIRKSPKEAGETLEKFSELLSHQIYEVKKEQIPLTKEIDNLSNFIEIQKLRLDDHINVKWSTKGSLTGLKISPMLFLNFVENAFKHASAKDDNVRIDIGVSVEGSLLEFFCVNTVGQQRVNGERPGVGLANARRRLEILYPDTHELSVEHGSHEFAVKLSLKLED